MNDKDKMSYTLEDLKGFKAGSDAAFQSAVNTALENARKASKAADAAWDAYDTTLDILNRENWEAARDAYDVAYDAADVAWENARNVINGK